VNIADSDVYAYTPSSNRVDFDRQIQLHMTFPELFPFGLGGVKPYNISIKKWIIHLLKLSHGRFHSHSKFAFAAFDIINRHTLYQNQQIKCKLNPLIQSNANNLTPQQLKIYLENTKKVYEVYASGGSIPEHLKPANSFMHTVQKIQQVIHIIIIK
jgi:hypothetical protein